MYQPQLEVYEQVQRWDVYDIADELADVPAMLREAIYNPRIIATVSGKVKDLESRLWAAADRGGSVGPSPEYLPVVSLEVEELRTELAWLTDTDKTEV